MRLLVVLLLVTAHQQGRLHSIGLIVLGWLLTLILNYRRRSGCVAIVLLGVRIQVANYRCCGQRCALKHRVRVLGKGELLVQCHLLSQRTWKFVLVVRFQIARRITGVTRLGHHIGWGEVQHLRGSKSTARCHSGWSFRKTLTNWSFFWGKEVFQFHGYLFVLTGEKKLCIFNLIYHSNVSKNRKPRYNSINISYYLFIYLNDKFL